MTIDVDPSPEEPEYPSNQSTYPSEDELELLDTIFSLLKNIDVKVQDQVVKALHEVIENSNVIKYISGRKCTPEDVVTDLVHRPRDLVKALLLQLGSQEGSPDHSKRVVEILINCSGCDAINSELVRQRASIRIVHNILDQVANKAPDHRTESVMLLSNITLTEDGCHDVLGMYEEKDCLKGYFFKKLLQICMEGVDEETTRLILNIIRNVTVYDFGRKEIMQNRNVIFPFLFSKIRIVPLRLFEIHVSILSIFKHLVWDVNNHEDLFQTDDIWRHISLIIFPAIGSPEAETLLQKDHDTRVEASMVRKYPDFTKINARGIIKSSAARDTVAEVCLGAFLSSYGRCTGRDYGIYDVIRIWDSGESEEEIKAKIEGMIHLIVYTEEELAKQDEEALGKQDEEALGDKERDNQAHGESSVLTPDC